LRDPKTVRIPMLCQIEQLSTTSACTLYAEEPKSQWKNPARPGQFSAEINREILPVKDVSVTEADDSDGHEGQTQASVPSEE
ncbi:hypothetical protein, partial [Acidisoma sp. 7E03]